MEKFANVYLEVKNLSNILDKFVYDNEFILYKENIEIIKKFLNEYSDLYNQLDKIKNINSEKSRLKNLREILGNDYKIVLKKEEINNRIKIFNENVKYFLSKINTFIDSYEDDSKETHFDKNYDFDKEKLNLLNSINSILKDKKNVEKTSLVIYEYYNYNEQLTLLNQGINKLLQL